jgi:hypothetical protein
VSHGWWFRAPNTRAVFACGGVTKKGGGFLNHRPPPSSGPRARIFQITTQLLVTWAQILARRAAWILVEVQEL